MTIFFFYGMTLVPLVNQVKETVTDESITCNCNIQTCKAQMHRALILNYILIQIYNGFRILVFIPFAIPFESAQMA